MNYHKNPVLESSFEGIKTDGIKTQSIEAESIGSRGRKHQPLSRVTLGMRVSPQAIANASNDSAQPVVTEFWPQQVMGPAQISDAPRLMVIR